MNILTMAKRRLAKHMVKILVLVALTISVKVIIFQSHPRHHSKNRLNVLGRPGMRSIYTDRSFRKQEQFQSHGKTEMPVVHSGVNLNNIYFTKLSLNEKYDIMEKYNKISEKRWREVDKKRIQTQLNKRSNENPMNAIQKERLKIAEMYKNIVSWSSLRRRENGLLDPLLNLHQFSYSLNSNACRHSPDVIIFVQSTPNHFDHRLRIRQTWGSIRHLRDVSLQTVFMVGKTDLSVQRSLQNESIINDDIVQGNFTDTYRNLTYKHIMALGWITANCPKIKLIIKVDDDTILNIFNLVKHITNSGSQHPSIYCSVFYYSNPLRTTNEKWYVSTREYPFEKYPDYCEGFGYLMTPEAARTVYKASEDARFYWVDDVYVTGILALKAGVRLSNFNEGHEYIRSGARMGADSLFISATQHWQQLWSVVVNAQLSAVNNTKLKV